MANKIDSSNRELIKEMIARGSSNADISKMTGVLKTDIEAFRQHPEKFSRKKSLEESIRTMYPTMPGYKVIESNAKKDEQDEPKVIPEISEGETVHESVSDTTDNEVVDLLDSEPVIDTKSPNDESKSEGQFAIVSFAYIGGIFKMLRSEEHLAGKEYPLVLDAPFSKLGAENRQNVVDIMPTFAPQVILFSKDDLHGAFPADKIGHVWTIVSNDEQNVARVEEGHLWN